MKPVETINIRADVPTELAEKVGALAMARGEEFNAVIVKALTRYVGESKANAAGGHARAAKLSPRRRSQLARKAVKARWAKAKKAKA